MVTGGHLKPSIFAEYIHGRALPYKGRTLHEGSKNNAAVLQVKTKKKQACLGKLGLLTGDTAAGESFILKPKSTAARNLGLPSTMLTAYPWHPNSRAFSLQSWPTSARLTTA
jgi:hypothetical protein